MLGLSPNCAVRASYSYFHSHAFQSILCPFRSPIRIQLTEEVLHKGRISVLDYCFSCLSHQLKLIVHVVHSDEMSSDRLLGSEMVDIRFCDTETALALWSACCAMAVGFDKREVVGEGCVTEIEDPVGCDGVAEAL